MLYSLAHFIHENFYGKQVCITTWPPLGYSVRVSVQRGSA